MKKLIRNTYIFGMANLVPPKTGLPVSIWIEHAGITRNVSHSNIPRVKIGFQGGASVSVLISENPEILTTTARIKKSDMRDIEEGIKYIARNHDLFLKCYMNTDYSFGDDELKDALRERGEYK